MLVNISGMLNNKNSVENRIGETSMPSYAPYYLIPAEEKDFFDSDEGKSATNAGVVLGVGLISREVLALWSNKLFTNYFSKHPDVDKNELLKISKNMLKDKINETKDSNFKNIKLEIAQAGQDAYFDHANNRIKITKDTLISMPHEIGHAVQEHGSKFFRMLQRNRGSYTFLALLLYGLGRNKPTNNKGEQTTWTKFQNILYKYNILVPLLAFSPELITEFKASKIGIDYLKQHVKNIEDKIKQTKANKSLNQQLTNSKNILKAAKKHYAIAFCTYLALPLFAMLDNLIFKEASKN